MGSRGGGGELTNYLLKLLIFSCHVCTSQSNTLNQIHWINCSAEAETKAKLEKVAEIKRINAQMMAIKSEISKHEDILKEYMLYKKFLERLTSPVWNTNVLTLPSVNMGPPYFAHNKSYLIIFGHIFPPLVIIIKAWDVQLWS